MSSTDSGPLAQVTAADVLRWGRAQPADTVIGVCDEAGKCLIAAYAGDMLHVHVSIYPHGLFDGTPPCYYLANGAVYSLLDELTALAQAFDALKVEDFMHWPDDVPTRYQMYPADLDRLTMEATP